LLNFFHLFQKLMLADDAFFIQQVDQRLSLDDFGHEQFLE
jgi:hypothetical protein